MDMCLSKILHCLPLLLKHLFWISYRLGSTSVGQHLGSWCLYFLGPKICPGMAWFAAHTHLAMSWAHRKGPETSNRLIHWSNFAPETWREKMPFLSPGLSSLSWEWVLFSLHKNKIKFMLCNQWVCKVRISFPCDSTRTEHANQLAPTTIGESIQLEKQKIC